VYEQFERVVLVHGCRQVNELAYDKLIMEGLAQNEFFGEQVSKQLLYYPTVTREPFRNQGRIVVHSPRVPSHSYILSAFFLRTAGAIQSTAN
jgi:ferredoxin-NADP reductase